MKSKIYIIFLLIFILVLSACQSTPQSTAVVNGGKLQQEIAGSPAPLGAYAAPASWRETLEMKNGMKTEIDATISVPKVTAFPVYNVEKSQFDDKSIKPLIDYFTKGKKVIKHTKPTKAELEKQLILAKTSLAKLKADPASDKSDIKDSEDMISSIEAEIPKAPQKIEPEVITAWSVDQETAGCIAEDNGEYAGVSVSPDVFDYINGYIETEYEAELNDEGPIGEVGISEDNAIAAAQNMLHGLGIDYMVSIGLEKAERYSCLSTCGVDAEQSEKPVSKGYLITLARNIDGISGIIDQGILVSDNDDFDYKAPLYPEEIHIYIDEAGKPQSFFWIYPLKIKEKVSQNVSLLPFDKVQQRIRDMLTFMNSYNSLPMKITKVELNMAIVNVKDHPNEAMYVPAWFIYYTQTFKDENKEHTQEFRLALNAIDGGRVLECPFKKPDNKEQTNDGKGK